MKKILLFFTFGLLSVLSFAQTKSDSFFVRGNYTNNIYTSVSRFNPNNYKSGLVIDFGDKHSFTPLKGLFLEGAGEFLFTDLPSAEMGSPGGDPDAISFHSHIREVGTGVYTVLGYDFRLGKNVRLNAFTGPEFRFLFKYYHSSPARNLLHKWNLRWKAGLGLNVKKLNVNLSVSPDVLDRGKGIRRYRTIQLVLGIGYYF